MSKLWTVTINRLQLISKFDEHGKKISDTVTKIPVTFCDLPYATAKMYLDKSPDDTTIVEQIAERAPSRSKYRERALPEPHLQHPFTREGIAPRHLGSEDLTPADAPLEAAMSGDFGAALTAELEAASS
jgi:hypothetical protein